MANYRIQHWPDMSGDGEEGDAIIFSDEWDCGDWERHKSWGTAWSWLAGNCEPLDRVVVMPPARGARADSYAGEQDQWMGCEEPQDGQMRRYVQWRINVCEHDHQVVREETGKVEIIGGAPVLSQAISIAEGDRIRVLYDPLAVEVRPLEIHSLLAANGRPWKMTAWR